MLRAHEQCQSILNIFYCVVLFVLRGSVFIAVRVMRIVGGYKISEKEISLDEERWANFNLSLIAAHWNVPSAR